MKLRNLYDVEESRALALECAIECKDPSLAIQSAKDEVDINKIVDRFGITGMMPQGIRVPLAADFYDIMDYRTALEKVQEAQDTFNRLPAAVRMRFREDAGLFVEFCSKNDNRAELEKMGLLKEKPAPKEPAAVSP